MRLVPTQLAKAAYVGDLEELERLDVVDCMECGSCAYTCPTKNQLVQLIRLGKAELAVHKKREKERVEQT
jgi:electron transport complex protein RnfC